MKRTLVAGVLTTALLALAAPAVAAPSEKAGPFVDGGFAADLAPNPFFCDFTVEVEVVGRTKTMTLSGGRTTTISPGMRATVTNPANRESVSYSISGTSHAQVQRNGDVVTTLVGRNLVGDPVLGLSVLVGRFTFTADSEGNVLKPAAGTGRVISVCDAID